MKIAIQGELGSNSHMAAREMLGEVEIAPCAISAEVLAKVVAGEADGAVLPIENSLHGSVAEHYDLLLELPVRIERESLRRIRHNLIAMPGVLLVATEDNLVYGLDPVTGVIRWKDEPSQLGTAVEAGEGKTINCTDLEPRVGITGTPVIDTKENIAYFVSNRYVTGGSGAIAWYMHAIKLDGTEVPQIARRNDGDGPAEDYRCARLLAQAVGIELEDR